MKEEKERVKTLFEKVWDESQKCSSSDLSIIVKKLNQIIEQINKNTERILKLYEISSDKYKEYPRIPKHKCRLSKE